MQLTVKDMNKDLAIEILNWNYDHPYDLYNNKVTNEAIDEFLNEPYRAIFNEDEELIGFFCTGKSAQVPAGSKVGAYKEDLVDIGLGMKPELTGQGLGKSFLSFIIESFSVQPLRLSVATFNKRAIKIYQNFGFIKDKEFTNGSNEFITMIKR